MNIMLKTLIGVIFTGNILCLRAHDVSQLSLPRVETVLKRVVERSEKENENDRTFNQRYSYTRTRATEYRNSEGDLKKREEKKSQNLPVVSSASFLPQPVGRSLGPQQNAGSKGSQTDSRIRGRALDKKDFSLDDDLLGRFKFTLAGRDTVNGRPMLLLDFKPANRTLPERNIKDRFINRAAGRVWVDEEDYVLAKADLRLTEKVNVIGGLAGAVWAFRYAFNRERTPDGLWFTRKVDWHVEGREVVLRRTIDYHEEKTDVRRAW